MSLKTGLVRKLASNLHCEQFSMKLLKSSFSARDTTKVGVFFHDTRISFSQIFPFYYYAREFAERFNAEFSYTPSRALLADPARVMGGVDIVLLQTWFQTPEDELRRLLDAIHKKNPNCVLAYFDSFAPADLRLARVVNGYVAHYVTKTLLKDRREYFRPTHGDTNLEEYFAAKFGLAAEPVDWGVPADFFDKLRLGPGFFTAPQFIKAFETGSPPRPSGREIDVHARLGGAPKEGWYGQMRREAVAAIDNLNGFRAARGVGKSRRRYMAELENSKICFSPFGYGEICWRDVEAVVAGALLVKPDMSHVASEPDMFLAGETYAPVAWDLSDLAETLAYWRENEAERGEIAARAFGVIADYVRERRFLDQMAFLFDS